MKLKSEKQQRKPVKPNPVSLEKISKIDRPLAGLVSKTREAQIAHIRNEGATDLTDIKWTVREYYEQFYANKIVNLDEVDRFLERQNKAYSRKNT